MMGGLEELCFDARGCSQLVDVADLEHGELVVLRDFVGTFELQAKAAGGDSAVSFFHSLGRLAAPGMLRIPGEARVVRVVLTHYQGGRPIAMIVGRARDHGVCDR